MAASTSSKRLNYEIVKLVEFASKMYEASYGNVYKKLYDKVNLKTIDEMIESREYVSGITKYTDKGNCKKILKDVEKTTSIPYFKDRDGIDIPEPLQGDDKIYINWLATSNIANKSSNGLIESVDHIIEHPQPKISYEDKKEIRKINGELIGEWFFSNSNEKIKSDVLMDAEHIAPSFFKQFKWDK